MVRGNFDEAACLGRLQRTLLKTPRWLKNWVKSITEPPAGKGVRRPRVAQLARSLDVDPAFQKAWAQGKIRIPDEARVRPFQPKMFPAEGAPRLWEVVPLETNGRVARLLGLTESELEWFADIGLLNPRSGVERLRHYTLQWRLKSDGTVRLLEVPKRRLKQLQRILLEVILAPIPVHEATHGFRPGRSIRSFAEPHVGREVVLRVDVRHFFPSITRARVVALFMTAGYPEPVALTLAGLCTMRLHQGALEAVPVKQSGEALFALRKRHEIPHLPQGAPTSPCLANLVAFKLDCRLSGLAKAAGARYTRYADDLLFSGDATFAAGAERFLTKVGAILMEEGFEPNPRKYRIQRQGVSQRAAGIVLNARLNPPREDYDQLKAILHNCRRFGPESQNRENHVNFKAHLQGRVTHLRWLNPAKGDRLQAAFDAIGWNEDSKAPQ